MVEEGIDFLNQQSIDLMQTLHYGAIVKIAPSGEESNNNFMFCDGFILTNIILQNFSTAQEDSCGCLFRIVPTFFSDVQNHILNEINETNSRNCIYRLVFSCFIRRKFFFF